MLAAKRGGGGGDNLVPARSHRTPHDGGSQHKASRLLQTGRAPDIHPCPTGVASTLSDDGSIITSGQMSNRGALNRHGDEPATPRPTCLAPPRSPVAAGVEPPPHPGARGWKQKRRSAPVPAVVTGARAGPAGMRTAWRDAGHDAGDSCTALWCCVAGRSSFLVTTGAGRILWVCLRRFTAHRPMCRKSQYTCCWMSGADMCIPCPQPSSSHAAFQVSFCLSWCQVQLVQVEGQSRGPFCQQHCSWTIGGGAVEDWVEGSLGP